MDMTIEEHEVLESASGMWWLFLVTGIGWLVFALLLFQWDYTTVYAISYLFGIVALFAGVNEFIGMGVWTTGWKIVHGLLGVLFVIAGLWALVHPHNAFATLAALIALFLLVKGIFDVTVAFFTKGYFDLWWLQLVLGIFEIVLAFWVSGKLPAERDPARRLRRGGRPHARDNGALRRVQAQVGEARARCDLEVVPSYVVSSTRDGRPGTAAVTIQPSYSPRSAGAFISTRVTPDRPVSNTPQATIGSSLLVR